MLKYVLLCIGGFLGAILRYAIKDINIYHYNGSIPLNTLFINVTGSFLIALILTVAFEIWEFSPSVRLGITTGFLGAYTTFSTLCKETAGMIYQGKIFSAVFYIAISAVLGLAAVYLGMVLARKTVTKLLKEDREDYMKSTSEKTESGVE